MELTPEDKQRIKQEAAKIYIEHLDYGVTEALLKMAEYATIYERMECGKLLNKQGSIMQDRIRKLEAERTELRNKVIDEITTMIKTYPWKPGGYQFRKELYEKLNSLKTK